MTSPNDMTSVQQNQERKAIDKPAQPYVSLEMLHEKARQVMAKHGFSYDGTFYETVGNDIIVFAGRPDDMRETEWLKCHYNYENQSNVSLQITFNSHHVTLKQDKNISECIFLNEERTLPEVDLVAMRKRIEEHRKEREEEAKRQLLEKKKTAEEQEKRYEEASAEGKCNYFERKGISHPSGIRYEKKGNETIGLIPFRDAEGVFWGLQEIYPTKRVFLGEKHPRDKNTCGLYRGCFFGFLPMGQIKNGSRIYLAEGYATAYSVFLATGQATLMCVACNNFLKVGRAIKERYPQCELVICGDNDADRGNAGSNAAKAAAEELGCKVVFPRFPIGKECDVAGNIYKDFDDLRQHVGLEMVKEQLQLRRPHLVPMNIEDFLQKTLPPKEIILAPWLREKDLVMIAAERGIGKTWLALNIAYAIAAGGKFLNFSAPKPRRVLYVDGEMAAVTMQERLAKIVSSSDTELQCPSYLKLITPDETESGIRDLGTGEGQNDIGIYLDDFDVLVLDNLSCLVRSGKENESESWIPVQQWLLELRKAGKTVIILHHTGKKGDQRGASKKEDVLDVSILLKKPKDHDPADGARFEFHFTKSRHLVGSDAAAIDAHLVTDDAGNVVWECSDIGEGDKLSQVVELHKAGKTQREIAKEIGVSPGTVSYHMRNAKAQGLVQ